MAAGESAQERTEQASAKRLEDARERGQIPRSRDLATMLILVGSALVLWFVAEGMTDTLSRLMRGAFMLERTRLDAPGVMLQELRHACEAGLRVLTPFLAVTVIMAVAGSVALGGLNVSTEALGLNWARLDPLAGIGRMFSLRSVVELFKTLAKFSLLLGFGVGTLYLEMDEIAVLGQLDLAGGMKRGLDLAWWAFLAATAGTVLIAGIDAPYQWWEHQRGLRMSRQELREEMRESEGAPEVRQRVRRLQQELASRRMMEEVPKADVVITNPTHYAVALRFDPATMAAPRLVAKGVDEIAQRIREVAQRNRVALIEAPPLARAIHRSTRLDHEIPSGLYVAVAQVLAYVFQLRRAAAGAPRPVLPREFPIPSELQA